MRPNATLDMSGTYGCAISRNGQFSDTTYIEVVVNESIIYQRVVDTCNSFTWLGVEYTESGHYEEHLTTTAGCDSIIDLTLTLGYTPEFEIVGNHWPIGGSETYISVNEYTIGLENPLTQIDTVLWSVDCENWRIEPHGKGESCTIYIFSFLEEPVMLHATVINACDDVSQEFFIQTSYFGVDEIVNNKGVTISPNPTDGEFTLHLDGWKGNITIELFDDQGRKVMQQSKESDNLQTIRLKDCRKGLYYLRVTDGNRCVTDKLIIQ